jgi:FKBP-type peptidyl-prolyl cis-trans isomerase FklB
MEGETMIGRKRIVVCCLGILGILSGCGGAPASPATTAATPQAGATTKPAALRTDKELASYTLGVDAARGLQLQGVEIDLDIMVSAMQDVMANRKLRLTEKQLLAIRQDLQGGVQRRQGRSRMNLAQDNKKQGEEFLAANKSSEGVVALPSGLQYKIGRTGQGPVPTPEDVVEVHFRGRLLDGTEFASTRRAEEPAAFKVSEAPIPAMREVLKMMPVGSLWQIFVPANLGFGEQGMGKMVGPDTVLIYDVELVSIVRLTDAAQAKKESSPKDEQ